MITQEEKDEVDVFIEPLEEAPQEEVQEEVIEEGDPLAKSVYEQLLEKGYIDDEVPFDGTFNYIDERLSELPQKLLRSAIEQLPDESQKLLKFVSEAGADLTKKELKEFFTAYLAEEDDIKVDSLDQARTLLEEDLKAKGLRSGAIQAQLDELEEDGLLLEEAEKIQKAKLKKTDKILADKIQSRKDKEESQRIYVSHIKEELEKTKWSKERQQKITQAIPKANEILNKIINTPKAYVQFIDLLTRFDGQQFDLEDFRKQGESRGTSSIKAAIVKNGFSSAGAASSGSKSELADLLKNYEIVV